MRLIFLAFVSVVLVGCSGAPTTDSKGKPKDQTSPPPPCHPGCFPAGTPILTPDGARPIESIALGESVTLVTPEGKAVRGQVSGTFNTCNRLVAVRTDAGVLRTTVTQPLCLQAGGFRPAGDLTVGDALWRWLDGTRQAVRVREVVPVAGEVTVYNLVVGADAVFVADGVLARGKPVP